MTKNKKIIIGVSLGALAIVGVYYWFKRLRQGQGMAQKEANTKDNDTPLNVFNSLKDEFKNDNDKLALLNVAERIYRHESANFTSNIYEKTKGAGVIATVNNYPFGWVLPQDVWENYGKPSELYNSPNGFNYIKFPSLKVGVRTVMAIIKGYYNQGYDASRYFSTNPNDYIDLLSNIDESNLFTQSFSTNPYLQAK